MTLKNGSVIAEMETIPDRFLANMNFLRGNISFSPQLKKIGDYAFYNCGLAAKAADIRSSATIGDGVFRLAPNFTGDVVIPEAFGLRPYQDEWSGKLPFTISGITSIDLGNIENFFPLMTEEMMTFLTTHCGHTKLTTNAPQTCYGLIRGNALE